MAVSEHKTIQTRKLFGFIPIEFETVSIADNQTGQTAVQKPFRTFLVFQLAI